MKLEIEELEAYLDELTQWDALEIQVEEKGTTACIPYVMNDAVECYVELEDCRIQGQWLKKMDAKVTYDLVLRGDRLGLILHQGTQNTISVWFSEANKYLNCYQYHRIGHRWRRKKGEEELRRLVNLLCVLHDKCTYLEPYAGSKAEQELMLLIEFAPLCFWTPINESIENWYPESSEGISAMIRFAEAAGDLEYADQIRRYIPLRGRKRLKAKDELAAAWTLPEHRKLLQLLQSKIMEASMHWPARDYGAAENERIAHIRLRKTEEWRQRGYTGDYPVMERDGKRVCFVEEQPYVYRKLEFDSYRFRIFDIEEE